MASAVDELYELEVSNFEHKKFVPLPRLIEYFTTEKIPSLLDDKVQSYEREEVVNPILKNGVRLFATLVVINNVDSVSAFLKSDNFSGRDLDSKLPLNEPTISNIVTNATKRQRFLQEQWKFLAPVLRNDQACRELDGQTILPSTSRTLHTGKGAFGDIYKIEIMPHNSLIHHTEGSVSTSATCHSGFLILTLFSWDEAVFGLQASC